MRTRLLVLILCPVLSAGVWGQAPLPAGISDNSFLIEEAYNQEAGVVQHIATFERNRGGYWAAGFTQEWPLLSPRHQVGATLSYLGGPGQAGGFDDTALHYRYQLAGLNGGALAVAPRVSALVPTGDAARGRGRDAWGVETNLPLSWTVVPTLVLHGNAGLTHVPSARNTLGQRAAATDWWLGASAVWLLHPTLNLLVEGLWLREAEVVGPGRTGHTTTTLLSPGFRGAINTRGGLQIVPGLAFPLALSQTVESEGVFLYLSFEHAFRGTP